MDLRDALKQLCSVGAPSGFERLAAEAALRLLRPYMDEVAVDRLGNVIGVKRCGKAAGKEAAAGCPLR